MREQNQKNRVAGSVGVLDASCTARYPVATLRHSLGLSALMIAKQAYAGTRRCGSAVDR